MTQINWRKYDNELHGETHDGSIKGIITVSPTCEDPSKTLSANIVVWNYRGALTVTVPPLAAASEQETNMFKNIAEHLVESLQEIPS